MRASIRFVLIGVLFSFASARAEAHFLFLRITPPAEGGRAAEAYFSDQFEAGDTRFIDKIAHTKIWAQTTPGTFTPLVVNKGEDRLRALVPADGSLAVIGHCEYGVLDRKNPFLLRHFPKAIAGLPKEINEFKATDKVPLEVVATIREDGMRFVALRNGKPVPGAKFDAVGKGLSNVQFAAGSDGTATWKPPHAGLFAVYTSFFSKENGRRGDKKFTEVRDFATLCFAWPLAPSGADPKAVALFQDAINARAKWLNFPGFRGHIHGKVDGRAFQGTVAVDAKGIVDLQIDDETISDWVQEQLDSIVLHRKPAAPAKSTPVLRFADGESDHPLGRLLIFEGGKMASSYRVKDKQITVVNRALGKEYMTITVLDNERNAEGAFLPRSYTVQYWDATSGSLKRTEAVQERWTRVGSWDLPAERTVTQASSAGLSVRGFVLSKHELNR